MEVDALVLCSVLVVHDLKGDPMKVTIRLVDTLDEAPKMNKDGDLEFEVTDMSIEVAPNKSVNYNMIHQGSERPTRYNLTETDKEEMPDFLAPPKNFRTSL